LKLSDIHSLVGGDYINPNEEITITGIQSLEHAGPFDIAFVFRGLPESNAVSAAAIVTKTPITTLSIPQIISNNPRLAMTKLLQAWVAREAAQGVDHATHMLSSVHESVTLTAPVHIGAFVSIGKNTRIGSNTIIHPNATIGDDCIIGNDCTIHSNASIYNKTIIGSHSIVHSGAVLGGDGFGYEKVAQSWEKIPHIGSVVVGDNVEIGCNACIDKGCLGPTRIGNGVKLDNFVHIAHNCCIGDSTVIAGGTLVGGSVVIGSQCIIAGNVAIADNRTIEDGATVLGNAGVTRNILKGQVVSGFPARLHKDNLKKNAFLNRLYDQAIENKP